VVAAAANATLDQHLIKRAFRSIVSILYVPLDRILPNRLPLDPRLEHGFL